MQVSSATQALQAMKAQQALEARRANRSKAPEQAVPPDAKVELSQAAVKNIPSNPVAAMTSAAEPAAVNQTVSPQWRNKVQDIRQVAEKAGFVDISDQDIQRAYTRGESLLADYRV